MRFESVVKLLYFLGFFFVPLWKNIVRVFRQIRIELFNNLVLAKKASLRVIEEHG
jgi:hypothetical protein